MVITRTPLRVSFAGGGSDRSEFIDARGAGRVVSTTVATYIHVTAHRSALYDGVRVAYTGIEDVESACELKHDIVRVAMLATGVTSSVELHTIADIPSVGSGLGASSALAVGCLQALYALSGRRPKQSELAKEACDLEIGCLLQRIGRQDQWACALGGVREYAFLPGGEVRSYSLRLGQYARDSLEDHMLLVWTGQRSGVASDALSRQTDLNAIEALAGFVPQTTEALLDGNMRELGVLLRESWSIKRELDEGVSSPVIDSMIDAALDEGAYGGKLCGAGGGGCILLVVPPERRESVIEAVKPGQEIPTGLDFKGSVVCYAQGCDHP